MTKAGILSMQRIANYGSFLQAYGLKKLLEAAGADVQFVDYQPGKPLVGEEKKGGLSRKAAKAMEVFSMDGPMKAKLAYIKYKKDYAGKYFPLLGFGEDLNLHPDLDLLVIGSDEVFNCVQSNPNVGYTPELFGQNSKAKRVVSYAGSFGSTTLEKLRTYGVDREVSHWMKDMDAISVRDQNSKEVAEELTGKPVSLNLDPVLMYDYMKEEAIPEIHPKEKYMILYGYTGRFSKEESALIEKYAREKGLKVYDIGGVHPVCDVFLDAEPLEVISWFKNAECIVTDTFHGTILSVITERPFVTMVRESGTVNVQKLADLLERLGLQNRRIRSLENLDEQMAKPIDYKPVMDLLDQERAKTAAYLKKQVEKAA